MEEKEIKVLIVRLEDPQEEEAYRIADKLAVLNSDFVLQAMLKLLYAENVDTRHLAARTLSGMEDNAAALAPLLDAIHDKNLAEGKGAFVEALEGFDISDKFVDIFRLYLFGGIKVQAMAKLLLDYTAFDISPRTIRKAEKHWQHYASNAKHDDSFAVKEAEINEILSELKGLFDA